MPGRPPPDQGPPAVSPTVPFAWDERPAAARIPEPLTSFIGRERESAAVSALLHRSEIRLLTLTGPGGIGKTRLAQRIGGLSRARYDDGVAFVSLASVRDPDLVLPSIAHALDVPELAGQPLLIRLQAFLAPRHLLLVLDNLEHLIEASPAVADLLATNPRLTVLCTSRTRLGISGEHVFTVPPLAMPDVGESHRIEQLHESDAVRLFVQRAEAHAPGRTTDRWWRPSVVALTGCRWRSSWPLRGRWYWHPTRCWLGSNAGSTC